MAKVLQILGVDIRVATGPRECIPILSAGKDESDIGIIVHTN